MELKKIDDHTSIVCAYHKTRNGFKHTAALIVDGLEIDEVKAMYLNRTWERFEYETVILKLLDKHELLKDPKARAEFMHRAEYGKRADHMKTVAMVAQIGDILAGPDQKARNDWKARMLKAGLENSGLIIPEDWDTLSEDEKERRLNAAINSLK
jgi:hypothetical protein